MELAGHKTHLVVASDIHLGTRVPTVWYQPDLHEPYLLRLLRWVVDQADHIRELVLLGDIVELWTYPAHEVPPTFADIVAAHPAILGPDGALAAVLDALDGAVTYVPGNHDMGITAEEVALVRSRSGRALRLVDDVPYLPTPKVLLAHGHHHTLFNAPIEGRWGELPLGYFVTRTVATQWGRDLLDGRTVADLAGQGAPNGINLDSLGRLVSGATARSIAATLIDFVTGATGLGLDLSITMPDGSEATLGEVRAAFADTWSDWAAAEGGGLVGLANAARAAVADFDGSGLGWFAQREALRHGADLVVMGHTHVPVGGLDEAAVQYLNSGFDCPSRPDLERADAPQQVTFVVVDTTDEAAPTGAVWAVDDEGCRPVEVAHTRVVVRPAQDFSCYVTLDNRAGRASWELVEHHAIRGQHVVDPPERIEPGEVARWWLQDQLGVTGSAGTVTYQRVGDPTASPVTLAYACPLIGANTCTTLAPFATRAGGDLTWHEGTARPKGHPFFVRAALA